MFSDNEPSCLSAHLSFSVINVKEDSFLMVRITHVAGKFLPRNNLHLLSSVCLCGLFHSGVIYCSAVSPALISHSSGWDVIFFSFFFSLSWYVCATEIESVCGSACYRVSSSPHLFLFFFFLVFPQFFPRFPEHVYLTHTQRMNAASNVVSDLKRINDTESYIYIQGADWKWNDLSHHKNHGCAVNIDASRLSDSVIYHMVVMQLHIWFLCTLKFIPGTDSDQIDLAPLLCDHNSSKHSFKTPI